MNITSSMLDTPIAADKSRITGLLTSIQNAVIPSLSIDVNDSTFMEVTWTPGGYSVEYRDGDMDHHYRSQQKLTIQEAQNIINLYIDSDQSWRSAVQFEHIDIRPMLYKVGFQIGVMIKKVRKLFKRTIRNG